MSVAGARDRGGASGPGPARLPAVRRRDQGGARPGRHDAVRLRELERDRDRLDVRRSRHLQEVQGARVVGRAGGVERRPARVLARRAARGLAARVPRAGRARRRRRGAAAADAAEGRARRRRPARDPAPRGAEALPRARPSRRSRTRRPTSSACSPAMDDVELRVPLEIVRTLGRTLRDADWKVTAVFVDDLLVDVEPGDTSGAPLRDRVRPRHDDRRRDAPRPRDRPAGRGALDAEQAAAVRRRRDLAHQRDDDGRRRARTSAGVGARDADAAHRARCARRRASSRARSTRSSSPAT